MNAHRSTLLASVLPLLGVTALASHMAAAARGPTPVQRSEQKDSAYVATFQGGSSVWMRAMRRQDRSRSS